jgi:hypothetical protein
MLAPTQGMKFTPTAPRTFHPVSRFEPAVPSGVVKPPPMLAVKVCISWAGNDMVETAARANSDLSTFLIIWNLLLTNLAKRLCKEYSKKLAIWVIWLMRSELV